MSGEMKLLVLLCISIIVSSLLEGVGIGILMPLVEFIGNDQAALKYQNVLKFFQMESMSRDRIVIALCVFIVVLFLIKNAVSVFVIWLNHYFTKKISMRWKSRIFDSYLNKRYDFFVKNEQGKLIQNMLVESNKAMEGFYFMISLVVQVSLAATILAVLFIVSWKVTLFFILVGMGVSGCTYYLSKQKFYDFGTRLVNLDQTCYIVASEAIAGIKQVKAFVVENFFRKRFNEKLEELRRLAVKYHTISQTPRPIIETLAVGGICILLVVLVRVPPKPETEIAILALFVAALFRLMPAVSNSANYIMNIAGSLPSIEIVAGLSRKISGESEEQGFERFRGLKDGILVKDLSFQYSENHNRSVLTNVYLEFKKGDFTAIVGPSGSGKSTVIDLILRFYSPQKGEILIDGQKLSSITLSSWRKNIGFVGQDTLIFSGTVKDNIAFGADEADMERIYAVAKLANAHDFIIDLPFGYATQVGEKGMKLSGGQRQRIAIARALYRDPEIMIFDEATSSLDTRSEKEVQKAIESLGKKKTLIVIAHRLSTVVNADKIYVLQDGRIVEEGTHQSLLQKGGIYWGLCNQQDLLLGSTNA